MTTALKWIVLVEAVGLLAFLSTWKLLRWLPDRGYCASKILGSLLLGTLLWLGASWSLLGNGLGGAALALLALALCAAIGAKKAIADGILRSWLRDSKGLVVAVEVVFLLAFAGWCLVRSYDPAADHTEQPMDLMFLTAVSSAETVPPEDPWLSGHPISYYYLGYWLIATLGHITGVVPELAYNLGQATWFGFLFAACFGFGYNLFMLRSGRREAMNQGVAAGVLSGVVVGITANLALPIDLISRRLAEGSSPLLAENWWWWRSSRVVHDTDFTGGSVEVITEFPFFSYLLGDNHPHLLSMPVLVLVATLALNVFLAAARGEAGALLPGRATPWRRLSAICGGTPGLVLVVAVGGSLAAINTWDVPTGVALLVAGALAGLLLAGGRGTRLGSVLLTVAFASVVLIGGGFLFLPYHLSASSQVQGLVPNLFHPTDIRELTIMFGTLFPGVVLLLGSAWSSETRARRALLCWAGIVVSGIVWLGAAGWVVRGGGGGWLSHPDLPQQSLGTALERWSGGWGSFLVVSMLLAIALEVLWSHLVSESNDAERPTTTFTVLLAVLGLGLVLAPELLYLYDSFGTRMNTVFKFYYQAWLLLGCVAVQGILVAWSRRGKARGGALLALCALLPGLVYPLPALWSKTAGFSAARPTLNALSYLEVYRPEEWEALRWVKTNTRPDSVVVQRSGGSYRPEHNLVSIATGRPTLLGWTGHELQWRGSAYGELAGGREQALRDIYNPVSSEALAEVVRSWGVDFVYLGPEERSMYEVSPAHEDLLYRGMELSFDNGTVRIFRRRG